MNVVAVTTPPPDPGTGGMLFDLWIQVTRIRGTDSLTLQILWTLLGSPVAPTVRPFAVTVMAVIT